MYGTYAVVGGDSPHHLSPPWGSSVWLGSLIYVLFVTEDILCCLALFYLQCYQCVLLGLCVFNSFFSFFWKFKEISRGECSSGSLNCFSMGQVFLLSSSGFCVCVLYFPTPLWIWCVACVCVSLSLCVCVCVWV